MNLEQWLTLALVIIGLCGGVWGIIKALLSRDRKNVEDQQKAMWKKVDTLREELNEARRELDVLKERVHGLPDWEVLENKIGAMEERLDKRFEVLARGIKEVIEQASLRFRCPHDVGG